MTTTDRADGAAALRRAMACFATGITIVTTRVDDIDHAMTANAFTSVSLDPPLVLLCVERVARFHPAVLAAGSWAVSILDAASVPVAAWLATRGRPLDSQLDGIAHHVGPKSGAALLDAAIATLECRTVAVHPGGDHDILVAEVLAAEVGRPDATALLYHRGTYATLPPDPEG